MNFSNSHDLGSSNNNAYVKSIIQHTLAKAEQTLPQVLNTFGFFQLEVSQRTGALAWC
uniref:Uncharacterized protein n=1 Tax=Rhizophora mucronata TaxID=61149 RepID=A0A2P2PQB0_RHIMU